MMIELCVVVEGPTEEGFVRDVLAPHLFKHQVNCNASIVGRPGKKGGVRSIQRVTAHLRKWMQDRRPSLRFTTMFDLYKLPSDFPGFQESRALHDAYARAEQLEVALAAKFEDSRFIPYLQLHEFEALLLADPTKFKTFFPDCERVIPQLLKLASLEGSPELINDGETTSPSKRVIKLLPGYMNLKSVAGPAIAREIGLATIREKCHHFSQWLTRLEELQATRY